MAHQQQAEVLNSRTAKPDNEELVQWEMEFITRSEAQPYDIPGQRAEVWELAWTKVVQQALQLLHILIELLPASRQDLPEGSVKVGGDTTFTQGGTRHKLLDIDEGPVEQDLEKEVG